MALTLKLNEKEQALLAELVMYDFECKTNSAMLKKMIDNYARMNRRIDTLKESNGILFFKK